jgi:hypothetical protein
MDNRVLTFIKRTGRIVGNMYRVRNLEIQRGGLVVSFIEVWNKT